MLRRRFQRPGPFSIWPVWKSMCHKVGIHALRYAYSSQPIVPFYEVDNLHSVSFRLVPVPPRLRRLVCRPGHSFPPDFHSSSNPLPFRSLIICPNRWCSVSVLRKKASPNIWPTYCRGMRTTTQGLGGMCAIAVNHATAWCHSRRSPTQLHTALQEPVGSARQFSRDTRSATLSSG